MTRAKTTFLHAAFALASAVYLMEAAPARAEGNEPGNAAVEHDGSGTRARNMGEGEARSALPSEGERESSPLEGITNWWSWDYGAEAKDPMHRGWPPPFGWALVNFGIFLGILSRILWKPLQAGWVERHVKIKGELDEASRMRREAEAQLAEYTKKVANVDVEVSELLEQLRKDAELVRHKIIAAAEAEAKRLRAEADRQIEIEIENARAALRREVVEAALKAAAELVQTRATADDQAKLTERYLSELEHTKPRTGGVA